MPYAVIDNCPVPVQIAPQVRLLKHAVPSAVLQSAYRGEDARPLLRRLHKHTQAFLFAGFAKHLPGSCRPTRPATRRTSSTRTASRTAARPAVRSSPGSAGSTGTSRQCRS
jgi:hypothetical protein